MAVKKYVKFDSEKGYLENKDDINYFATNQMRKVAFGKMLGDFDENGLYVINQKIVEELIKMPKVVVEIIDDSDLIRSKVKADTFFHFILTIEDNKATLKLLEKIHYQSNRDFNSGAYSNINEYVLDQVVVPDKDFDRNVLYEKYNISTENDGEALSIFDMDELSIALYYNIIEKLKINYLVQNELMMKEKELEEIEADYFEQVLQIFEEYKEFGSKVTAGVKKDLAEKHMFVIISKPFFQRTVNEILDSYIDFYLQDLTQEQKEQLVNKLREVKANYYQKFKTLIPMQIAQKAGVRFDATQIAQESVIGDLVKEISTKGFTSSDVRKILVKDSELQLSIAKIREILKESEEICKRDNAKAKDITKNRLLTTGFYAQLEKEKKVDILKPDTTLIKSAIEEKVAAKTEQQAKSSAKVAAAVSAPKKAQAKKSSSTVKKAPAKTTAKPVKPQKQQPQKQQPQSNTKKQDNSFYIYGSGTIKSDNNKNETGSTSEKVEGELDKIVGEEVVADKFRKTMNVQKTVNPDGGILLR